MFAMDISEDDYSSGQFFLQKKPKITRTKSYAHCTSQFGGQRGSLFSDYMIPMTNTINDPIQCGYFLAFCEHEHSLENLLFVMAVDRFRDEMRSDKKCWHEKWFEIDSTVFANLVTNEAFDQDLLSPRQSVWPSKVIQRREVERKMKDIWETYLSDASPRQICITYNMRSRIKTRMELVHLYGPAVFNEALYDPLVTLRNDTLPRFKASVLFQIMNTKIDFCCKLPLAASLDNLPPLSAPSPFQAVTSDALPDSRLFDLSETLSDAFLYREFLTHLQEIFSSENLLCIRNIVQFEQLIAAPYVPIDGRKCSEEAETCAWEIYRYFVATGSPFEITLSIRQRKDVMISLAKPNRLMFKMLQEITMGHLVSNFNSYKFTDSYLNSSRRLREDKRLRKIKRTPSNTSRGFLSSCLF